MPLVLEQRGGEFAVNYREYIKEHFAEDIGLDYKTGNDVKNDVANCVLAGLVEIMLYELSSEIIPDEFTYTCIAPSTGSILRCSASLPQE